MRRRLAQGIGFVVVSIAVLCMQSSIFAADIVPADKLLPPNVYLLVDVPSVPDLKARVKESPFGQLLKDEALADFRQQIEGYIDEQTAEPREQLGLGLQDLADLPTGRIAFAVTRPAGGKLGFVLIADTGSNQSTIDRLIELASEQAQEKGAEREVKQIAETEVVLFTKKEKEEDDSEDENRFRPAPQEEPIDTVGYFIKDGTFVVSSGEDILTAVLERWDGQHEATFAANETHSYIADKCKLGDREPLLNWYVDPIGLTTVAIQTAARQNMQAQMALQFLPLIGLGELKAVGGSVDAATDEFGSTTRTFIYVDGPTRGLLRVFRFPAADLSPPKWVTGAASSYASFNWDLGGAYSAIEAVVDGLPFGQGPGTFAGMIEGLAQREDGPMIHIKDDLIDHLSGRIHVIGAAPEDGVTVPNRALIALDADDAEKMQEVIDTLAQSDEFPGEERDFQGTKIYEFDGAAFGDATTTGAAAIVNGSLMITNDVDMLEQAIAPARADTLLSETDAYKQIARFIPKATSILGIQKHDDQSRAAYEAIRSGEAPMSIEGIDFSKLPPFEAIEKYLPPTASYAIPDDRGALYVGFSLRQQD